MLTAAVVMRPAAAHAVLPLASSRTVQLHVSTLLLVAISCIVFPGAHKSHSSFHVCCAFFYFFQEFHERHMAM